MYKMITGYLLLLTTVALPTQAETPEKPQAKFDFPLGVEVKKRPFLLSRADEKQVQLIHFLAQANLEHTAFLVIPATTSVKYQAVIKLLKQKGVRDEQIQVRFDLSRTYQLQEPQVLVQTEVFQALAYGCNSQQIGCATQSNYLHMLENPRHLYKANKSPYIDAQSVLERMQKKAPTNNLSVKEVKEAKTE